MSPAPHSGYVSIHSSIIPQTLSSYVVCLREPLFSVTQGKGTIATYNLHFFFLSFKLKLMEYQKWNLDLTPYPPPLTPFPPFLTPNKNVSLCCVCDVPHCYFYFSYLLPYLFLSDHVT